MKVAARDVEARIARPDPAVRAFLIYGPDRGLVRERADRLAEMLLPGGDDPFALDRLSDEDLKAEPAALADAMAALSLTGGDRLVRVRLSGDHAGTAGWIADHDAGAAPAEARLIIETGELRPTAKLRKAAEGAKSALALPCYADAARDLTALAQETFAAEGLTLEPEAAERLAPMLAGDRALARAEIEKLLLYKGLSGQRAEGDDRITQADIAAVSAGASEAALDLAVDPALAGAPAAADRGYQRALAAGLSPVAVLRTLQRRIDQIAAFHTGGGSDAALARSGAPRFGPPASAFKASARRWSGRRLAQARRLAFDAERAVKRTGAPADVIVGALLLRLARAAEGRG